MFYDAAQHKRLGRLMLTTKQLQEASKDHQIAPKRLASKRAKIVTTGRLSRPPLTELAPLTPPTLLGEETLHTVHMSQAYHSHDRLLRIQGHEIVRHHLCTHEYQTRAVDVDRSSLNGQHFREFVLHTPC